MQQYDLVLHHFFRSKWERRWVFFLLVAISGALAQGDGDGGDTNDKNYENNVTSADTTGSQVPRTPGILRYRTRQAQGRR